MPKDLLRTADQGSGRVNPAASGPYWNRTTGRIERRDLG